MSVALIPLWMLSGAMFPASGSGWVRWLMRVDPMTYAVSAVRRGLTGAAGAAAADGSAVAELGVTALFALLAIILAVSVCKRRA